MVARQDDMAVDAGAVSGDTAGGGGGGGGGGEADSVMMIFVGG